MPDGKDRNYLWDIVDSAETIQTYILGLDEQAFYSSMMVMDAVTRRFEIIGEAAGRLSNETKASIPGIPRKLMVGMRNRLIHEYENVRSDVIWESTQKDLQPLISAIQPLIENEERLGENF